MSLKELDRILKQDRRNTIINLIFFLILFVHVYLLILFSIVEKNEISILVFFSAVSIFFILIFINLDRGLDAEEACHYYLSKEFKKYNLDYSYYKGIKPYLEKEVINYLFDEGFKIEENYNLLKGEHFVAGYLLIVKEYVVEKDGKYEVEKSNYKDVVILIGELDKRFYGFYVLLKSGYIPDLERIKLDMPEFEKLFDLYGTDQIEGRYIFNFSFMESLLNVYYKKKFKKIIFYNEKFYIYFETGDLNLYKQISISKRFLPNYPDAKTCVEKYTKIALSYANIYDTLVKDKIALKLKNKRLI